jgi:hypothetical protein
LKVLFASLLESHFVEVVFSDLGSFARFVDFVLDLSVPPEINRCVFFGLFCLQLVVLALSGQLVNEVLQANDGLSVLFGVVNNFLKSALKLALCFCDFRCFLD